jgi:hypothetical protein
MTRTATGATLDLLNALEPEAKAGWEEEILNIPEAIAASQAITDRRKVAVAMDTNTINLTLADPTAQAQVPSGTRETYDPDYVAP